VFSVNSVKIGEAHHEVAPLLSSPITGRIVPDNSPRRRSLVLARAKEQRGSHLAYSEKKGVCCSKSKSEEGEYGKVRLMYRCSNNVDVPSECPDLTNVLTSVIGSYLIFPPLQSIAICMSSLQYSNENQLSVPDVKYSRP